MCSRWLQEFCLGPLFCRLYNRTLRFYADEPKTPYLSPMDTDEEGDLGVWKGRECCLSIIQEDDCTWEALVLVQLRRHCTDPPEACSKETSVQKRIEFLVP